MEKTVSMLSHTNASLRIAASGDRCADCTNFWRNKFRNKAPGQTMPIREHNLLMKRKNTEITESKELVITAKKRLVYQTLEYKNAINKLRKKVSYWKGLCKNLRAAVKKWREVECKRKGFVVIEEEEANKWHTFYKFIDELIGREYFKDP
jgi:hypothetical protein